MMFKENWEKTSDTHSIPERIIKQMVRLAYRDKKLIAHELLPGGCANLNIKILLQEDRHHLILRIYLRDQEAAYREQRIALLLKQHVPVPLTYYIATLEDYRFAITEFLPGISLRTLLLSDIPHDVNAIMQEVGATLAQIAAYQFPKAGLFTKELEVKPYSSSANYLNFAKSCLKQATVLSVLTTETIAKINQALGQYNQLFADDSERHLVHADFDPANILVDQIEGAWKISGILDWEFAFSGSVLWDIANMLRYAHKLPLEFKTAFIKGFTFNGLVLPNNWEIKIKLLNLLALLDCLKRSDPKNCPKQCADICELINDILPSITENLVL